MFSFTAHAAEVPKVGDKVPDFEMRGSDGKSYAAKDFVGEQAVIIAWFPRAFTGGCTKEVNTESHGEDLAQLLDKLGVEKRDAAEDNQQPRAK